MTPAQEIAKLKERIAHLEGEVSALKYVVAVSPPTYVPAPRSPMPTYPWYSQPNQTYPAPPNTGPFIVTSKTTGKVMN